MSGIGVVELAIIVCGGGLTVLAVVAISYMFIQNRKD